MQITFSKNGEEKNIRLKNAESVLNVHVKKNVSSSIILNVSSGVQNAEINVYVEDSGSLNILCLSSGGVKRQKIFQKNTLKSNCKLNSYNVLLGSDTDYEIISCVEGSNSGSSIDFISYANKKEQQNISVKNIFNSSKGSGKITIQSVAENKAKVECNGKIEIGPSGGGTDTYLTENMLILDPACTVDATPALEIKTNDVKASHSATVAHVTEEDLFTFGSRGIAPVDARKMFVLGFFGSFLEKMSNADFKDRILVLLEEKYTAAT